MVSSSVALRRAAASTLTACAMVAAPLLMATPALADAPPADVAPTLNIISQVSGVSTAFDGISSGTAQVVLFLTDPSHKAATVRAGYYPSNSTVDKATFFYTSAQAPFVATWTPPAPGNYYEVAQALDSSGAVLTSAQTNVIAIDATSPTAHIVSPAQGSAPVVSPDRTIVVSGTRTADLPSLTVATYLQGKTDSAMYIQDNSVSVPAGDTTAAGASNAWSATVPLAPCGDPSGCNVYIDAAAYSPKYTAGDFAVEVFPVSIGVDGPALKTPAYGSDFSLTGFAPANSVVTLHLHKAGTANHDYSILRQVTADGSGVWTRKIAATSDYRLFATEDHAGDAGPVSAPVHIAVAPTVAGAKTRQSAKHAALTISGMDSPGSVVVVHVHKAGQAAGVYAIAAKVQADSAGKWNWTSNPAQDERFFVSRSDSNDPAGQDNYLVQAR